MKTLLTLFVSVCALALPALATTTVVSQNIVGPDGLPASGTVTIRATAACTSGTDYVGTTAITIRFTGGSFSTSLVPNDTCIPSGTTYLVTWNITGSNTPLTQHWLVTTSSTALKVSDVVQDPPPTVTALVDWTQMKGLSYTNGTYCVNIVSNKVTGLVPCASGGSTPPSSLSWSALTFADWGNLSLSSWSSIAN